MTNPEIISRYANLKEAMAKEQQDLPDWWKSQFNIGKAFGLDKDYYVNLEATLFLPVWLDGCGLQRQQEARQLVDCHTG